MNRLERIWWRRREPWGARARLFPLTLAEGIFRAVAGARGALYRTGVLKSCRAEAAVISVGNVTVGGSGKTPAVMSIARALMCQRRRVAILSRGYGAQRRDARLVADGQKLLLSANEGGDEPVLLARRLPGVAVLCGPRRVELARRAVEELGRDTLLLDDAFQHRALARDLDVVVVDASNPFGNGHCLPRGPNREPLSALGRAGLIWLSRVDQVDGDLAALERLRELAERLTGRPPVESRHAPRQLLDGTLERELGLDALRGRRVMLLSGLARPASFRLTVESLGADIAVERTFPDHHPFTDLQLDEALAEAARWRCEAVVITEKDAVRLPASRARDPRFWVVCVEAEIVRGQEVLHQALAEVLDRHSHGRPELAEGGA